MGEGFGGGKGNSLKQPKDTHIMFFKNCIQFRPECSRSLPIPSDKNLDTLY